MGCRSDFGKIAVCYRVKPKRMLMSLMVYLALGITILFPIGRLFLWSFKKNTASQETIWTFANYTNVFMTSRFMGALINTIIMSFEVVLLATVIGVLLAWLMARTDMPLKKFLEPLNLLPFYLSSLVGGLSWQVLAAPRTGILNNILQSLFGFESPLLNIYSVTGMSIVLGLFFTPYVYLFTIGSFQNMDPSLEDAARVSGASTTQTMLRVTFPLSAPAIISAGILVFMLTASTFGVPLILGGPGRFLTLSTLIWSNFETYPPNYNAASALSSLLIVITGIMLLLQFKIIGRRQFWTVTGKGFRPRLIPLGRFRWLALGINIFYLALVLLPFFVLFLISFIPGYAGEFNWKQFSLANYRTVLQNTDVTRRALLNSSIIAIIGGSIGIIIYMFLSSLIIRTKLPGRRGMDLIGMSPVAFPGIALGVSFLICWISTPLYGTLWIIMLAYIVQFMPTGLRSIQATLNSISPDLDQCARTCGATWFGALRLILIPLSWPGLMATWLLLFVTFMREISASMMLFVNGTETISVALIQIMEYENQGASAAFGITLTVIILIGVYIFRKVTSNTKG